MNYVVVKKKKRREKKRVLRNRFLGGGRWRQNCRHVRVNGKKSTPSNVPLLVNHPFMHYHIVRIDPWMIFMMIATLLDDLISIMLMSVYMYTILELLFPPIQIGRSEGGCYTNLNFYPLVCSVLLLLNVSIIHKCTWLSWRRS